MRTRRVLTSRRVVLWYRVLSARKEEKVCDLSRNFDLGTRKTPLGHRIGTRNSEMNRKSYFLTEFTPKLLNISTFNFFFGDMMAAPINALVRESR
jgi:hypothetical protein